MSENEVSERPPAALATALLRARDRAVERRAMFVPTGAWMATPTDLVSDAAVRSGHETAVLDRERCLTYGELDAAVDRAVARLRGWGVEGGGAVLLVVQNDVASVVAIHAVLRAGGVAMVAPTSAGA